MSALLDNEFESNICRKNKKPCSQLNGNQVNNVYERLSCAPEFETTENGVIFVAKDATNTNVASKLEYSDDNASTMSTSYSSSDSSEMLGSAQHSNSKKENTLVKPSAHLPSAQLSTQILTDPQSSTYSIHQFNKDTKSTPQTRVPPITLTPEDVYTLNSSNISVKTNTKEQSLYIVSTIEFTATCILYNNAILVKNTFY